MSNLLRRLAVGTVVLMLGAVAPAQSPPPSPTAPATDWSIASAPARYIIQPDQPDKKAPVTWVNLFPPDARWVNMPIRVFTDTGTPVGSDVLWSAPGEPTTIVFDSSSGAKRYFVYLGSDWPVLPLGGLKGGVLLESRAGDGKQIDHLPDMLQAWNASKTVYGLALIPAIFEGGHRFGPQGNLLEHFQAPFALANDGPVSFAAISNDASFVLVDGKEVVEWPGAHDFRPGLGGQFQGTVNLTAGAHVLDYYYAFLSGNENHPLLACLAAKGGPLTDWTMLTPDNKFFLPSDHAHLVNYELQLNVPGNVGGVPGPAFAFDWGIEGQSVLGSEIPDPGLIALRLNCRPQTSGTVNWTFDDGTTAKGQSVPHLFPRPGMRTVQIEIDDGDKSLHFTQTISVHPNWTQLTTYQPQLNPDHQKDIMGRDPAIFSTPDLASCYAVFSVFKDTDGLLKFLPAISAKMKDVSDSDLPYFKEGTLFLAHGNLAHAAEATQLLNALIARCAQGNPTPTIAALESEGQLALAQLTLKTTDHTDDVKKLLDAIRPDALNGEEHRMLDLLRADLAFATGDIVDARKQYIALTGDPSGPDARSSIRRTAKIGQARTFLDRKDFEAAEDALNEVAWQAPIEKLSPDWALTRLRLYQEQNLPVIAYLWGKRLLPVITEANRSELLFRLTDLAFAQGDNDLAQKTLAELLKKHPYSEEAAQAKEKWPGKE